MKTRLISRLALFATFLAFSAIGLAVFSVTSRQAPPAHDTTAHVRNLKEVAGQKVEPVKVHGATAKAATGRIIVKLKSHAAAKRFARKLTATTIPQVYLLKVTGPVAEASARIAKVSGVASASPDYVVTMTRTPNDPLYGQQWNLTKIGMPAAWDRTTGSDTVKIASIDTGVNTSHQDLSGKIWTNSGETCGNDTDDDNNGYIDDCDGMDFVHATTVGGKLKNDANGPIDDEGHGTLTASVAAAATDNATGLAGIDWRAKIIPIKVLDENGSGFFSDVAEGIRYAGVVGADVGNLSLGAFGVDTETATDTAILEATAAGTTLVAASGNEGSTTTLDYPAINPAVISVGATGSTDARSSYSNGGPELDVVAPGSSIRGAGLGNTSYTTASGTSLSTPHVSAAVALLRSLNPSMTPTQAKTYIRSSADKVSGMNGATRTDLYGYGRLNVQQAMTKVKQYSSQFVTQSAAATTAVGQDRSVYVDYKNTGTEPWSNTGPNRVVLTTSNPLDHKSAFYNDSWLSYARVTTFDDQAGGGSDSDASTVSPGETARFSFTMTAPARSTTATLKEYFRPRVEGVAWMEDAGKYVSTTVPGTTYKGQLVAKTNPPSIAIPNSTHTVTVDVKNIGTATWRRDTRYNLNLATVNPLNHTGRFYDPSWQTRTRLAKFAGKVVDGNPVDSDSIAPGETGRWNVTLKAPATGGAYKDYYSMAVENFGWPRNIGLTWAMAVPSKAYDYSFVSKSSHYQSLDQDQTKTISIRLKNTGSKTWYSDGSEPVRLGTSNPHDRGSGFSDGGTAAGWLGSNRIKLSHNVTDSSKDVSGETSVAPGETGEFQFDIVGKPRPGTYDEHFQPVSDGGGGWMKDIGIHWVITVANPIDVSLAAQSSATLRGTGTVTIRDVNGTNRGTVNAATDFSLKKTSSGYQAVTPDATINSCCVLTAEQAPGNRFRVMNLADNASYDYFRGAMSIRATGSGTRLINSVNLEDYLKGLGEVPDGWPIEAIKSQVTAARTYAARKMASPRDGAFDLYDDTRDQVYNGYDNEVAKPNHVTAVGATNGKVIKRDGALIQAFYSSNAAGYTASNEEVWGGSPINYLRGKTDPYSLTSDTDSLWPDTTARSTIQANYGYGCTVTGVSVVAKYTSGRVKTIRLSGSGCATKDYTLNADTHRSRLGLPSSQITGITKSGTNFVFAGKGFGHGIGMSQWGAYRRALAGQNYVQILQFYYTGVSIGSL